MMDFILDLIVSFLQSVTETVIDFIIAPIMKAKKKNTNK